LQRGRSSEEKKAEKGTKSSKEKRLQKNNSCRLHGVPSTIRQGPKRPEAYFAPNTLYPDGYMTVDKLGTA
jgi:hypothetical protein